MTSRIRNENIREELLAWSLDPEQSTGIEVEEFDWDEFEHVVLEGNVEKIRSPRRNRTIQEYRDTHPSYTHGPVYVATPAEIAAYERDPARFAGRSVRGAK